MKSAKEKKLFEQSDWVIPIWLKALVAGLLAGMIIILLRSLTGRQEILLGVHVGTVRVIALTVIVSLLPFAVAFGFYPDSVFSRSSYWCICFLREQIYTLSLVGVVYLFHSFRAVEMASNTSARPSRPVIFLKFAGSSESRLKLTL